MQRPHIASEICENLPPSAQRNAEITKEMLEFSPKLLFPLREPLLTPLLRRSDMEGSRKRTEGLRRLTERLLGPVNRSLWSVFGGLQVYGCLWEVLIT